MGNKIFFSSWSTICFATLYKWLSSVDDEDDVDDDDVCGDAGQRLIKKCDYHLGQQVHAMFRIAAAGTSPSAPPKHVTMFSQSHTIHTYIIYKHP
jgi:hypothetical protein